MRTTQEYREHLRLRYEEACRDGDVCEQNDLLYFYKEAFGSAAVEILVVNNLIRKELGHG